MSTANQQTLAEAGSEQRPPILEKRSYMPWSSLFLRFLDNRKEESELMRKSIDSGPLVRKKVQDPTDASKEIDKPVKIYLLKKER
nr:hypothetical protein [Tanacetum cinerariifolium]